MKTITLKLTLGGRRIGPFTLTDNLGNIIATDVPKDSLINGVSYVVDDGVTDIQVTSTGLCTNTKTVSVRSAITPVDIANNAFRENDVSSLWKHIADTTIYNKYYGGVFPYVIEHPFAYKMQDEILQSVKEYSRVYQYLPDGTGVYNNYEKIEVDDVWFNKAIIYNNQQNSGLLEIVKKPKNNLQQYNSYPIYRSYSKVITYAKSDNYYLINNFWDCIKDKTIPSFVTDCNSLSVDKMLNQSNFDYSRRSYTKAPLRAKDCKVRFYLDNTSAYHIISTLTLTSNQISYK